MESRGSEKPAHRPISGLYKQRLSLHTKGLRLLEGAEDNEERFFVYLENLFLP